MEWAQKGLPTAQALLVIRPCMKPNRGPGAVKVLDEQPAHLALHSVVLRVGEHGDDPATLAHSQALPNKQHQSTCKAQHAANPSQ